MYHKLSPASSNQNPQTKRKKQEKKTKKARDESRRESDRRSSVHEPRTVEVALLIIGTYQPYQRKKMIEKKTQHNGGKNLIRSFA